MPTRDQNQWRITAASEFLQKEKQRKQHQSNTAINDSNNIVAANDKIDSHNYNGNWG